MLLFMVLSIWGCSREKFEPEQCDLTTECSRTETIRNARAWFEKQQPLYAVPTRKCFMMNPRGILRMFAEKIRSLWWKQTFR